MSPDTPVSFTDFVQRLSRLGGAVQVNPATRVLFESAAEHLAQIPSVTREALIKLTGEHPDWTLVLALVVGLSQEQFRNILRHRLGSSSWIQLARTRAADLVNLLDDEFALVNEGQAQRDRDWSFADVLLERAGSRGRCLLFGCPEARSIMRNPSRHRNGH